MGNRKLLSKLLRRADELVRGYHATRLIEAIGRIIIILIVVF